MINIKNIASLIGLVLIVLACNFESSNKNKIEPPLAEGIEQNESAYDSIRAAKYGADEYGMKKYVIAFLKRGPNRTLDRDSASALQRAHLDNIGKMVEAGKLVLAGPFFGKDDLRGIYIFNVASIEEAEALTNTDPAIKAGSLIMELKEWYGSAALMAISEIHKSIAQTEI